MEEHQELFKKIEDSLTDIEKDVFNLRIQGFNYKEIEQLLNISKKTIDGRMARIKNKVSNIIDKEKM